MARAEGGINNLLTMKSVVVGHDNQKVEVVGDLTMNWESRDHGVGVHIPWGLPACGWEDKVQVSGSAVLGQNGKSGKVPKTPSEKTPGGRSWCCEEGIQ